MPIFDYTIGSWKALLSTPTTKFTLKDSDTQANFHGKALTDGLDISIEECTRLRPNYLSNEARARVKL